ncbi:MAG: M16 family metallopeptidase [Hyalangium sp.]|uniref:M16 family metallopeptidase n=1 Tax=Hyalangium sp. TaxID=2028555 RepID=UPI00389A6FA1
MHRQQWFIVALTLLVGSAAGAQARPGKAAPAPPAKAAPAALGANIEARTLKNGLKIIVWPDQDIPNVSLYTFFRVGSRNERPGITGLSHFFEHMMFNGAKKYGPGQLDAVMADAGGKNNASTSEDTTTYVDWFPSSALETIFDIEGDRMAHLAFDPKIIESERGVVYSERRSVVDNDNMGALLEQVQATAFVAHPYQITVIGWPSDIESWRMEDLQSFFKTYYAPNNATMVVVGAVTPSEVFALAEKYIGAIPAQPPPEPVRTKEPEQQGEKRVLVRRLAQAPLLQVAYHAIDAKDPDLPALTLLLHILAEGESSRLHQRLVEEERVAIHVNSQFSPTFDPSLVWFLVDMPPGTEVARVEKLLGEELDKVRAQGVTEAELRKAKNITVADFWRELETNSARARSLGTYEVFFGDWHKLFEAPARYEQVTREQIRKVAERILNPDHRTVGVLVPTEQAQAPAGKEAGR